MPIFIKKNEKNIKKKRFFDVSSQFVLKKLKKPLFFKKKKKQILSF